MEQIINYRDIPTDKRLDILNALERIGFFPAYGGVKTMQQIMEKSVPGSGPKVDVDEQRELAIQYRVMSVPTVIFLKDGKEVDRKIGVREPAEYTERLDACL